MVESYKNMYRIPCKRFIKEVNNFNFFAKTFASYAFLIVRKFIKYNHIIYIILLTISVTNRYFQIHCVHKV